MNPSEPNVKQRKGKCLIFEWKSRRFYIPTTLVKEIVKPLPVTPVPFSSASLRGIFNLRGAMIPLYDLSMKRNGENERKPQGGDMARFLVISIGGNSLSLMADRIVGIFDVGEDMDYGQDVSLSELENMIRYDAEAGSVRYSFNPSDCDTGNRMVKERRKTLSVLMFLMDRTEYAMELDAVSELILTPESESVFGAPAYIRGVAVNRDLPLHLVDLSLLFDFNNSENSENTGGKRRKFVLVMPSDGTEIGLIVDDIKEIVDVEEDCLRKESSVLNAFGEEIQAVIDRDDGKRPVLLINHRYLASRLDHTFLRQSAERKKSELGTATATAHCSPLKKMLLFSLLDGFFAVPVEDIREICTLDNITPLPIGSPYIAGVTNVRGVVHSVFDLKKILGLQSVDEEARIVNERVRRMFGEKKKPLTEKSKRHLIEFGSKRVFGSRAYRQLLDDLSESGKERVEVLDDFERRLFAEADNLIVSPKILIMTGPDSRALMVDTVRAVIEIEEEKIKPVTSEEGSKPMAIAATFRLNVAGDTVKIPELKRCLADFRPGNADG